MICTVTSPFSDFTSFACVKIFSLHYLWRVAVLCGCRVDSQADEGCFSSINFYLSFNMTCPCQHACESNLSKHSSCVTSQKTLALGCNLRHFVLIIFNRKLLGLPSLYYTEGFIDDMLSNSYLFVYWCSICGVWHVISLIRITWSLASKSSWLITSETAAWLPVKLNSKLSLIAVNIFTEKRAQLLTLISCAL